jgi:hypothetical protein
MEVTELADAWELSRTIPLIMPAKMKHSITKNDLIFVEMAFMVDLVLD